jgi:hypothetical protein
VPGFVQCGGIQRCTNYRNYLDSTQPHYIYTPHHYQHCYHHPHLIRPSCYFFGGGAQG